MLKLYDKAIEHYKNNNKQVEEELCELANIHHLYRTRRVAYWATCMLLCSIFPCFAALLRGVVFVTGDYAMDPLGIRWLILGVAAFCSICVTPFVVKHQQNSVKEHNHRLAGKSQLDIRIDDFKTYLECMQTSGEHTLNNKIISRLEEERQNQKDKEELLTKLSAQYEITPKNTQTISVEEGEYERLNAQYKDELKKQNQNWAASKFFEEEFKHDWMSDAMTGIMMAMMFVIVWDMPFLILVLKETILPASTLWWALLHSVALPVGLGFASPYVVRWLNKKRKHKVFISVANELGIELDTAQYSFDAQNTLKENITALQDKISLTTIKIIQAQMM